MTKRNMKKSSAGTITIRTKDEHAKEIADLKAMVKNLKAAAPQARKFKPTGLGQGVLDVGNAVTNYFGLGKIFGSGAYRMSNSKWDTSNQVPVMHSDSESVTVRHREYIGDVVGTAAFTTLFDLDINPGLASTFPYLSGIANQFQEYRFKGLVFEYKTQSGMLTGANTALGDVMMVAQYRADAPLPTSKLQLLNEMWSQSVVPSQSCFLPIECAPKENPMRIQYVRSGLAPGDQKLYDLANFSLATIGTPVNFLGELWCTYEVELYKPVMNVGGAGPYSGTTAHYTGTVQTTANSYVLPVVNYDDIGLQPGINTINIPCQAGERFLFVYTATGTTTTAFSGATINQGTATITNALVAGDGTNKWTYSFNLSVLTTVPNTVQAVGGGVIGVTFTATVVGGLTWTLVVTQLPSVYI